MERRRGLELKGAIERDAVAAQNRQEVQQTYELN